MEAERRCVTCHFMGLPKRNGDGCHHMQPCTDASRVNWRESFASKWWRAKMAGEPFDDVVASAEVAKLAEDEEYTGNNS